MRRRIGVSLVATVALIAVATMPAGPAGAQDLADLPRMGFAIDSNEGYPGDVVGAQVDPDDVAEHCLTISELYDPGPPESGALMDFAFPFVEDYMTPIETGDRPTPGGMSIEEFTEAIQPVLFLLLGVVIDPDNLTALWENLFVLTFVEPATTEMVGPMGGFDPVTGEGEIVVPELDPTLYVVAAACVNFLPAEALLPEGGALDQVAITMNEWLAVNYPDGPPPFDFPPSEEFGDFVLAAAQVWLPMLVEPQAIGLDFYCILQDDGFCATPPGPVELIDEDVIDAFNGDADELAPADDALLDVEAVTAAPAFTG